MYVSFLKKVKRVPPDPIFGLQQAFMEDSRSQKINLGIGSYKNEALQPQIFTSVKKAEKALWEEEVNKEYLPIAGFAPFIQAVKEIVFHKSVLLSQVAGIQCIGGTGALRLGGEFLYNQGDKLLFIPDLTWDNHRRLFEAVGFKVDSYPYFNPVNKSFDCLNMLERLKGLPQNSIVVLQGCCHNPTGVDPTLEEWKKIAKVIKEGELIPFFDFAYQGFGEGLAEDAAAIRYFASEGIALLVASSFSKNFGLYNERVGALFVVGQNEEEALNVESCLKVGVRTLYSNPPSHGAKILAHIIHSEKLKAEWASELATICLRLKTMREKLLAELNKRVSGALFEQVARQKGMFSYLGLSENSVEILKKEYAIYMVKGGRINVSGLNATNIPLVAEAIIKVL